MSLVRRSFISALNPASGEAVVIRGWVHRLRVLAKTTFIIVKDCTGEAQLVAATESLRDLRLKLDDAVEIHGVARADDRAKAGFEIDVNGVVIGAGATPLGMPPHGGLAIGLERLTTQILGLQNIREATLYPRDRYHVTP